MLVVDDKLTRGLPILIMLSHAHEKASLKLKRTSFDRPQWAQFRCRPNVRFGSKAATGGPNVNGQESPINTLVKVWPEYADRFALKRSHVKRGSN